MAEASGADLACNVIYLFFFKFKYRVADYLGCYVSSNIAKVCDFRMVLTGMGCLVLSAVSPK